MATEPDADPRSDAALLQLVDACFDALAGWLHNRPVQQLVAAKLMLETIAPVGGDDLFDRASSAVGVAGRQARDLMWLLTPPDLRPDAMETDVRELLTRPDAADLSPHVTVSLGDADHAAVTALVRAVHHLLADALLGATTVRSIAITSDAETVDAEVELEGEGGTWTRLAAARVAAAGGRITRSETDDAAAGRRTVILHVPVAG